MYYVYILRGIKTGKHYIGYTNNLQIRLDQHNSNKTRSLRNKGPFQLIRKEEYASIGEAKKRERQIKKFKGGRAFQDLLNSNLGDVV